MNKHKKTDTILLTILLFALSGGILAYNIHTVNGGELAVSLRDLAYDVTKSGTVISTYAEANLANGDSIYTAGTPSEAPTDTLLAPIVTPPTE
ncbi:MAG: hypothetical protein IJY93_08785 [Clostridia bacterium]|nr:hypothetical protein [Clostridia bacterium]